MDKVVKISIIVGVLAVSLSVAYYLVFYIPQRDRAKLEQQKQEQQAKEKSIKLQSESLSKCLEDENDVRNNNMQNMVSIAKKQHTTLDQTSFDSVEKSYQSRKADCFTKYPQ